MSQQGFKFAPVTYGLAVVSSIGFFFSSRGYMPQLRLGIDVASLTHGDFMRLLTSGVCFPSYPQVISSVILLHSFRQFERQMGSLKFGSFVFTSYVLATLAQVGLVVTASSMGFTMTMAAGPYFLVFSLLAFYQKLVPKLHPTKSNVFTAAVFSEKSWIYLLALQLCLSEGPSSFLACVSGLLSGYFYLNDLLGVQRLRLPPSVGRLFSPLSFLFGATASSVLPNGPNPTPPGRPRVGRDGRGQGAGNGRGEALFGPRHGGGGFQQPVNFPPPPPAPEEAIESLMNLGFERDRVIRALQSRDNNLEAAANFLLSGND